MSSSPGPIAASGSGPRLRRVSSGEHYNSANGSSLMSPAGVDELVNYYEAEEERIINLLSRKLEQLRLEKVNLENALEQESESQVNRLNRELSILRRQQLQQGADGDEYTGHGEGTTRSPGHELVLDILRRENENLRARVADLEKDFIRMRRLNEVYREEIIDHRTKAGIPIDNLLDLDAQVDITPYSPIRRSSTSSSPSSTVLVLPPRTQRTTSSSTAHTHAPSHIQTGPGQGVPIPLPRTSSSSTQIYPVNVNHYGHGHGMQMQMPMSVSVQGHGHGHGHSHTAHSSISSLEEPSSVVHSPIFVESPYTFSPANGTHNPASYASAATNFTTPPSSTSLTSNPPMPYPLPPTTLSYPSVPPPSLSSSLGSPVIQYHPTTGGAPDPLDLGLNRHRRNSSTRRRGSTSARVAETGSLRDISESRSRSRRESINSANPSTTPPSATSRYPASGSGSGTGSSPIPIRIPGNTSREGTPVNR